MNDTTKKKPRVIKRLKFFLAWQEQKERQWLEEMAQNGWLLSTAAPFLYTFEEGEPGAYTYQFDFNPLKKSERQEYLQLYQDDGWEKAAEVGSWFYFRKKGDSRGSREIYTDPVSLKKKYKRLLGFLLLVGGPLLYQLLYWPFFRQDSGAGIRESLFFTILYSFMVIVGSVLLYAIIRTVLLIKKR